MKFTKYIFAILSIAFLVSCGGSNKNTYKKSAIDKMIVEYMNHSNYSILLSDMDYDESANTYKHKYKVIIEKPHSSTDTLVQATDVEVIEKPWQVVSDQTFNTYKDNLGMTIVSKKNGALDKVASPAGYDNYVGNPRYGSWRSNSTGGSFWIFYGQYRFLSDVLMGPRYRYPYSSWNTYDRSYRGRTTYYGSDNRYGTKGTQSKKTTWGNRTTAFRNKVNSNVAKSASRSSNKRSRTSSRYSSSSSRSRSGGYGK